MALAVSARCKEIMRSPPNKQLGMIAILDALGAASYSDEEIQKFLQSRNKVLDLLDQKIDGMADRIERSEIEVFTFNDTILIAYKSQMPRLDIIDTFFIILRKFVVDSLSQNILFRGSVAIGSFYVDKETNTVMGEAVTDAAAWYDKADWIGVQATPKATIIIQQWLETIEGPSPRKHLMLDYDVPLKDGKSVRVKVVNWPKVFFVNTLTPCRQGEKPREKLLTFLSNHSVPPGTEKKFFNSIAFFDHVAKQGIQ